MIGGIDIRDVAGCTCLHLRRMARQSTQHYDAMLAPIGLTIGQFGLLAQLYGAEMFLPGLSLKALAERVHMDPTTLNRTLKPLEASELIHNRQDPENGRARLVNLTDAGRSRLAQAVPLWAAAQEGLTDAVGRETVVALNGLLELSSQKLRRPRD